MSITVSAQSPEPSSEQVLRIWMMEGTGGGIGPPGRLGHAFSGLTDGSLEILPPNLDTLSFKSIYLDDCC